MWCKLIFFNLNHFKSYLYAANWYSAFYQITVLTAAATFHKNTIMQICTFCFLGYFCNQILNIRIMDLANVTEIFCDNSLWSLFQSHFVPGHFLYAYYIYMIQITVNSSNILPEITTSFALLCIVHIICNPIP